MKPNKVINILFLMLIAITMQAQNKTFTLEDLNFGGTNYYNMSPKNQYYSWWGDKLIQTETDKCNIVDIKTGKKTQLFTLEDINSWAKTNKETKVRHLMYATFPYADKSLVLIYCGKTKTLLDWKKKQIIWQPTYGQNGGSELEWNKDSRNTAFLKDNNLYVEADNGEISQLSTDGSKDIVYGQAVHRDEFGIYKGTFWSKDGTKLAFYRMDQSMVEDYPQVNTFTDIATNEPEKYPMAGRKSHVVKIGVFDTKTKKTIYLNTTNPIDRYFTNIQWNSNGTKLYILELNRDQTDMELVCYNANTGEKESVLYTEHNDKYTEPQHPIIFLPWDDSKFILQSQKDGYNHLYLFNTNGEQLKQLTSGKWVVLNLMGFNIKTKSAIILSTESNPIQNNLYSVNIETGKRTLLDNGKGCHANTYSPGDDHHLALSESGSYLVDNYTEPSVPRNINIVNTANKQTISLFKAENPWKGYDIPEFSCGTVKAADGVTDLYYRLVKPTNFDKNKKYPTVVYVYGGPHARNVEARWNYYSRGWETYMAQKGYVVFILDNRGSKDRGVEFEQATFRKLGQEEMKDQVKGVEFLKTLPYVDTDRIGVHGWSFGGFMTISLMVNYPEIFKVGVAGGPVIDWKWYEVMYGERYMDTPQSNPEGYKQTSLLEQAKNLKGKLQIIQGMNDPVVLPQHCLQFLNACILEGTQPDFFVYPGEPHNMRGHQSVHLHERITQYFEDFLKPLNTK